MGGRGGVNRNVVMRESLNEKLANPDYQLADRLKVWGEIGKKPPGPIPGTATPAQTANRFLTLSRLPQQVGELGDVRRDPLRLWARLSRSRSATYSV
jgi:hypothetical protein